MSSRRKGTEFLVGLFIFMGFGCIGTMVVVFGSSSSGTKHTYPLIIDFPNASGIIKGNDVLLSGARIGQVSEPPLLLHDSFRVQVTLAIQEDVHVPRGAAFLVGSTGLLGDHFVDVRLTPGFDTAKTIEPGERVRGGSGGGLDELTSKGGAVFDQLSEELEHIQIMTKRLNEGVLHERNLKNIEETFANLRATTDKFKETSQSLEVLVARAGTTLEAASATMKTADAAAGDLRSTIGDLRKTIDSATKAVDSTAALVKKASEGSGPLPALLNDKKMADDLRSLVANLRRSGVLFYKDRPAAPAAPSTPVPARR